MFEPTEFATAASKRRTGNLPHNLSLQVEKFPSRPSRLAILSGFAAIYIIWGSTYLGIRVAVSTMPPFLMAGMRFCVAGILLFIFLIAKGVPRPTGKQWFQQTIIGFFMLLGSNGLVSWAEQRTPSGITSLILGASPISMILMDWLRPRGSRPSGILVFGAVLGVAGIAILLGPGAIPAGHRPPIANIVVIALSSVNWWIGSFYSRDVSKGLPMLMFPAMQMVSGGVLMLLTSIILGEPGGFVLAQVSPSSWLAFSYLVIAGSVVAFPVYIWLLEHSTPAKVSTFAFVNPVVAVVLGWAILGEPMNLRIVIAAAVIVSAVVIITVGKNLAQKPTLLPD